MRLAPFLSSLVGQEAPNFEEALKALQNDPTLEKTTYVHRSSSYVNDKALIPVDHEPKLPFVDVPIELLGDVVEDIRCTLPFHIRVGGQEFKSAELQIPILALQYYRTLLRAFLPAARQDWPEQLHVEYKCTLLREDHREAMVTSRLDCGELLCAEGIASRATQR